MANRWNCDVCGRLTNRDMDTGHHIHQGGGFACSPCGEWAKKMNLTCPTCGGNLIHGPYDDKCSCSNPPRVTRSGRHYSIEEA